MTYAAEPSLADGAQCVLIVLIGKRTMQNFELVIRDVHHVSPLIREFVLESPTNEALAPFTAGAHLQVTIPELNDHRCYSLIVTDAAHNWSEAPQQYRLGVRLEAEGNGGSKYMHQLEAGATLSVKGPINDFPLTAATADEKPIVLIAGGIGITPIASMAHALLKEQRPFTLHYSARSQDQLAFADELQTLLGDQLVCYTNDSNNFELNALFDSLEVNQPLYVCGPQGLIDAVIALSKERGWAREQVHFELFITAAPLEGDQPFEVELRQSGLTFTIPADKTIIQVLEEAGEDPMYDCNRGECGVCTVDVLEGTPDHRDYFLSDKEKASGSVIQICISRSKSPKLVLDM